MFFYFGAGRFTVFILYIFTYGMASMGCMQSVRDDSIVTFYPLYNINENILKLDDHGEVYERSLDSAIILKGLRLR